MCFWNLSKEDCAASFWSSQEGRKKGGPFIGDRATFRPGGGLEHRMVGLRMRSFTTVKSQASLACLNIALPGMLSGAGTEDEITCAMYRVGYFYVGLTLNKSSQKYKEQ